MRRIIQGIAALTFAAGAMTSIGATGAQAAGTYQGCPYGAVCVYPQGADWNGGHPSDVYYSYGAHNLSNQTGTHIVFNNQSDGATAHLCTGYDGAGCGFKLNAYTYTGADLTPINSITLDKP